MTKIVNADIKLTAETVNIYTDYIPIGRVNSDDSISIPISELVELIGDRSYIVEGNTKAKVYEGNAGYFNLNIDTVDRFRIYKDYMQPVNSGVFDIGSSAFKFKNLHIAGGIKLEVNNPFDMYYNDDDGNLNRIPIGLEDEVLGVKNGVPTWIEAITEIPPTVWGDITGTLSDQTDLLIALNNKQDLIPEGNTGQYYSWDKTWRQVSYTELSNLPTITPYTASNVGIGTGIYKELVSNDFKFKTLTSTDNTITITSDATTVNLSVGTVDLTGYVTLATTQVITGYKTFRNIVGGICLRNSTPTKEGFFIINVPDGIASGTNSYLSVPATANNATWILPSSSGTLALTTDIPALQWATGSNNSISYITRSTGSVVIGGAPVGTILDSNTVLFVKGRGNGRDIIIQDSGGNAMFNMEYGQMYVYGILNFNRNNGFRVLRGGYYTEIRQPTGTSNNLLLTLPSTAGTAGQALITNGSGVLSWATVGDGDPIGVFDVDSDGLVPGPSSAANNIFLASNGTWQTVDAGITTSIKITDGTLRTGEIILNPGNAITIVESPTKTFTFNHSDTSSQADTNNSGVNVIQNITLDTYGHIQTISNLTIPTFAGNGIGLVPAVGTAANKFLRDDGTWAIPTGTAHDAVTLNGSSIGYLTLTNQELRSYLINLNTHTTGSLPINKLADYPGDSNYYLGGSGWVAGLPTPDLSNYVTISGTSQSISSTKLFTSTAYFNNGIAITSINGHHATLRARNDSGTYTLTLPSALGLNGQVLLTDEYGYLYWGSVEPGGTTTRLRVTSIGTYRSGDLTLDYDETTGIVITELSSTLFLFSHADTSNQSGVMNDGFSVLQSIGLDGFGHVTGIISKTITVFDDTSAGLVNSPGTPTGKFLKDDNTWQTIDSGISYTFAGSLVNNSGTVTLVNDTVATTGTFYYGTVNNVKGWYSYGGGTITETDPQFNSWLTTSVGNNKYYGTNGSGTKGWYNTSDLSYKWILYFGSNSYNINNNTVLEFTGGTGINRNLEYDNFNQRWVLTYSLGAVLNYLSDVTITSPQENDILKYNGTSWVNAASSNNSNVSISSGLGMNFSTITGIGSIIMGTPSIVSGTSTNSVSGTTHTHALGSHTMVNFHTGTSWRLFYTNGSGAINELALGTNGQVLTSTGTTSVPGWTTLTPGNTTAHSIVDSTVHTDVLISNLQVGEILKWNGSKWINSTDLQSSSGDGDGYISNVTFNTSTGNLVFTGVGNAYVGNINLDNRYLLSSDFFFINNVSVTGTTTKTIRLTYNDSTFIETSFTDNNDNNYVSSITGSGNSYIYLNRLGLSQLSLDLTHTHSEYLPSSTTYVSSFNSRSGVVSLLKADVEAVLQGLITSHTHNYTNNVGTVTSVTAGSGLSQSGTSNVNPTLYIQSVLGTAGSVGTIVTDGGALGISLGNTSITAAPGDHTHSDLHTKKHSITSGDDHEIVNAWKVFYTSTSKSLQELSLSSSDSILTSTSNSTAPIFKDFYSFDRFSYTKKGLVPAPTDLGSEVLESRFLRADGEWIAPSGTGGGMSNPMDSLNDIIIGGTGGTPVRLGKGANGTVLTINTSGNIQWIAPEAVGHGNHTGDVTSSGLSTTLTASAITSRLDVTSTTFTDTDIFLVSKSISGTPTLKGFTAFKLKSYIFTYNTTNTDQLLISKNNGATWQDYKFTTIPQGPGAIGNDNQRLKWSTSLGKLVYYNVGVLSNGTGILSFSYNGEGSTTINVDTSLFAPASHTHTFNDLPSGNSSRFLGTSSSGSLIQWLSYGSNTVNDTNALSLTGTILTAKLETENKPKLNTSLNVNNQTLTSTGHITTLNNTYDIGTLNNRFANIYGTNIISSVLKTNRLDIGTDQWKFELSGDILRLVFNGVIKFEFLTNGNMKYYM